MASRAPSRLGMALKNQMCTTGAASSMWPIRLRRTRLWVIFTPQRSQIIPLYFIPAVLAARAFPVLFRAKDALAEQAVLFRTVGAIVDRLGLLHLAERPATDVVRPGQTDLYRRIIVNPIVCAFADTHWNYSLGFGSSVVKFSVQGQLGLRSWVLGLGMLRPKT